VVAGQWRSIVKLPILLVAVEQSTPNFLLEGSVVQFRSWVMSSLSPSSGDMVITIHNCLPTLDLRSLIGYYHWFVENFLRIGIVYDYLLENPEVKILAYSIPNAKYFYEMIGLPQERVVQYKDDVLYHANRYASEYLLCIITAQE
jgi:hypothetical protein